MALDEFMLKIFVQVNLSDDDDDDDDDDCIPCIQVTGVLTQGRGDGKEWVTAFMISHSMDAFHWKYITDVYGNQRVYGTELLNYIESITVRFIRY